MIEALKSHSRSNAVTDPTYSRRLRSRTPSAFAEEGHTPRRKNNSITYVIKIYIKERQQCMVYGSENMNPPTVAEATMFVLRP
jgi:hypothetical protein